MNSALTRYNDEYFKVLNYFVRILDTDGVFKTSIIDACHNLELTVEKVKREIDHEEENLARILKIWPKNKK